MRCFLLGFLAFLSMCIHSTSFDAKLGFLVRMHQSDGTKMSLDFSKLAACGLLAVHHVNNRISELVPDAEKLYPGLNVTYDLQDTRAKPSLAAEHANDLAVHQGVDAILGPGRSAEVGPVAIVAGAHEIPSLSYAASSTKLSDDNTYRLFSRTAFTEKAKADVVIQICVDMGWRKLAILYRFDLWGSDVQSLLVASASRLGVAVAGVSKYVYQDTASIEQAMTELKRTGAHIFVFVAGMDDLEDIAFAAGANRIMGPGYVWINVGGLEHPGGKIEGSSDPSEFQKLVAGIIDVKDAPFHGDRAQKFEGAFSKVDIEKVYHPTMEDLGGQDLRKGPFPFTCANLYDAVWAAAFGISKAAQELTDKRQRLDGSETSLHIRRSQFYGAGGWVAFNEATGDRLQDGAAFEVRTWVPVLRGDGTPTVEPTVIAVQRVGDEAGLERLSQPYWPGGSRSWSSVPGDGSCPAGSVASPVSGVCEACPPGSFSDGTSDVCQLCSRGHYAPTSNSPHCLPCKLNGYADEEGLSACKRCPGAKEVSGGVLEAFDSVEDCRCPPGFVFGCQWELWQFLVLFVGCVALLSAALLVRWWAKKRLLLDPEDRLVMAELGAVRRRLHITSQDGFLMPGEWRSWASLCGLRKRQYTRLSRSLAFNVVRFALLLNFEPMSIDVLATVFKLLMMNSLYEADVSVRTDISQARHLVGDEALCALESSFSPDGARSRHGLKQLQALNEMVLDVSRHLLDPTVTVQQEESPRSVRTKSSRRSPKQEEGVRGRPQSEDERLHYFVSRVWKLRLWDEVAHQSTLRDMTNDFLRALRASCDERCREMQGEEGGEALAAWGQFGVSLPRQMHKARQDDPQVGAIRVDAVSMTEMGVQLSLFSRAESEPRHPRPHSPLMLRALSHEGSCSDIGNSSRRGPASRMRSVLRVVTTRAAERRSSSPTSPNLSTRRGRSRFGSDVGMVELDLDFSSRGRSRTFEERLCSTDVEQEHAPSPHPSPDEPASLFSHCGHLSFPPEHASDGSVHTSASPPIQRSASSPFAPPASPPRSPRVQRQRSSWGLERLSTWQMEELDRREERGGRGQGEWRGVDEELFVVQLRRRAALLNAGFQHRVRDLVAGGKLVHAGPLKSKQRMLDLVEQRGRQQQAAGADGLPFAADILDPVRASVVCQNPRDMLQLAEWLVASGESTGLPVVKVSNKFAAGDPAESGTRDLTLHVLFESSNGLRLIGEIQLHDPVLYQLGVKMHRLERVRRLAAVGGRRYVENLEGEDCDHAEYRALLEEDSADHHDLDAAIANVWDRGGSGRS